MKFHNNRMTRNVSKVSGTEVSGEGGEGEREREGEGEDTPSGSNFCHIQTLIKI